MNKAVILAFVFTACHVDQKDFAEAQAREYTQSLSIKDAKVVCMNEDTDPRDGYVSCTISSTNADGKNEMQSIECAAKRVDGCQTNRGCRIPKNRQATESN